MSDGSHQHDSSAGRATRADARNLPATMMKFYALIRERHRRR